MGGIPRRFINFLILHINFCFLIHLVRTKTDYGGTMEISIFFKQMAQRTCAIFLVKIIGFLARIPLFRMLGPEGIGLYQMAYSVYGLILTLLLGGFPAALALATSKNAKQGWRLFERLSFILVILSAIMSFATFYFSEQIAALLGDPTLDFFHQMCVAGHSSRANT
jgi:stage V sporulation protein B